MRVYPCVGSLAHQAESPDPGPVLLRREGRVERRRKQDAKRYAAASRILCGNSGGLCGKNIMLTRAHRQKIIRRACANLPPPSHPCRPAVPSQTEGEGALPSLLVEAGGGGWSGKLVTQLAPCPAPRLEAVRSVCYSFPLSVVRSSDSARGLRVFGRRGLRGEKENGATKSLQKLHQR
jgi:hypothetical protein